MANDRDKVIVAGSYIWLYEQFLIRDREFLEDCLHERRLHSFALRKALVEIHVGGLVWQRHRRRWTWRTYRRNP